MCDKIFEFKQMSLHVLDRLEDICFQLQQRKKAHDQQDTLVSFAIIILRFCRLLLEIGNSPLRKFTGCRATMIKVQKFHEELDIFMETLGFVHNGDSWKEQWEESRLLSLERFNEALSTDESLNHDFVFASQQSDAILLLQYELQARGGETIPGLQNRIKSARDRLLRRCKAEAPAVPTWFVSRDDVEFHSWNLVRHKSGGDYYEGKWRKTSVMVEESSHCVAFERDAGEWYKLNHPNVAKLFGACDVRSRFFMYELVPDAKPLHEFLRDDSRRGLTWKCLYEAALGLQHLHNRGIAHKDLRSGNIIVGSDTIAKLCGLRHLDQYADNNQTRSIWKALEMVHVYCDPPLNTACDIYAFGKCIWEALTLELPSQGLSSNQPANIGDAKWDLITKMCAKDPSERVSITYVVNRLKQFIIESEQGRHPTLDADSKVILDCRYAQPSR